MASNNIQLFNIRRLRDIIVAQGHTMPSVPKCMTGGGISCINPDNLSVGIGSSVPISRGSPPIFIDR